MKLLIASVPCVLLITACGSSTPHSASATGGSSGGGSSSMMTSGGSGNTATAGSSSSGGNQLAIMPPTARVKPKAMQTFTCSATCKWSVQEGDAGGTISKDGVYTAPSAVGTYHVVATAGSQMATATVAVPAVATGTPGKWEDVTDPAMDPARFTGSSGFGMGTIVGDPARPSDVYIGGQGSIWKSTDYGLTWSKLDTNPVPPALPLGTVLAIAGTTPPTVYMANVIGEQHVFKSTDGGKTFTLTGTIPEKPSAESLYSIQIDPGDPTHLITGLHEADKVLESTDAGDTWHFVSGNGFPSGGISWYPWFINTGDNKTTSTTWLAIAQDGGSAIMTTDSGKNWAPMKGINGLQHPHGNASLLQNGKTLFIAGVSGENGNGVYRSTDLGQNWEKVVKDTSAAMVWGSDKNVYAMWAWACAGCGKDVGGGSQYMTAPMPGAADAWVMGTAPDELDWGPNSIVATSDGDHTVYIGSMWATGIWRYVEP